MDVCILCKKHAFAVRGDSFEGKTVVISGSGNVAQYACEKATQVRS